VQQTQRCGIGPCQFPNVQTCRRLADFLSSLGLSFHFHTFPAVSLLCILKFVFTFPAGDPRFDNRHNLIGKKWCHQVAKLIQIVPSSSQSQRLPSFNPSKLGFSLSEVNPAVTQSLSIREAPIIKVWQTGRLEAEASQCTAESLR
jgi:hypothetical protein